ncbi:MAG: UDP-3-O-(3-hydroxymyristoyl)glucosamine N-acyltransferase [Alteromonadaceae bacterium]|nr:MAG: UDP-3-O-(3-hydroxymyristoyl)glucosamine N-acyltransferase [Alteromonadaceae bacterium]
MFASKSVPLAEIATVIGAKLAGSATHEVNSVAPLSSAKPDQLSFLSAVKYVPELEHCNAGVVILTAKHADMFGGNCLIVDNPYLAYAKVTQLFDGRKKVPSGVHSSAFVADSARIAPSAAIGANCVIGDDVVIGEGSELYPGVVVSNNVTIGDACLVYANVSIYSNVTMGDKVTVHSNTVIGSDGFGFAPCPEGWEKVQQFGGVRIGNNVDIGASVAIDRGALEDTIIGDGVIIDNQVHIAHNVKIGERTAMAGGCGVAGSATIGADCTFAGFVCVNGHISIADKSHFNGATVVTQGNSEPGVFASAAPLQSVQKWRRSSVRYQQLDDIAKRLNRLEKQYKQDENL